jgi:tetratricopeptide (TPR) repeat protein
MFSRVRLRGLSRRLATIAAAVCLAALAAMAQATDLEVARGMAGLLARAEAALERQELEPAATLYLEALDAAAGGARASDMIQARALDGLAETRHRQGRLEEAAELYGRSLPVWERLLGDGGAQPRLAVTLHNLAAVHVASGHPERARPLLERALAIWDATLGPASGEALSSRRLLVKAGGEAATRPEHAVTRPPP